MTTGVNVPHISGRHQAVPVSDADDGTAARIASILGAYDDLIEVNRRRIAAAGGDGAAAVREWFVPSAFRATKTARIVNGPLGSIRPAGASAGSKELVERRRNGRVYKENDCEPEGQIVVIDQSSNRVLGYHSNEPDHHATALMIQSPSSVIHVANAIAGLSLLSRAKHRGLQGHSSARTSGTFRAHRGLTQTREYKRHWNEFDEQGGLMPPPRWRALYAQM